MDQELLDAIEDSLEQVISDTIDMDWQPRWAAKAICEILKQANVEPAFLKRLDEIFA